MWRVFLLLLIVPFTQLLCLGLACTGCRLVSCMWLPCTVVLFAAALMVYGGEGLLRVTAWLLLASTLSAACASIACLASKPMSLPSHAVLASEAALALYYASIVVLELQLARSSRVGHIAAFALAILAATLPLKPPLRHCGLAVSLLAGSLAARLSRA